MGRKARSKRTQDASTTPDDEQSQLPHVYHTTAGTLATSIVNDQKGEYYEVISMKDRFNKYRIVDLWRSYRNDATNLQPQHAQNGTSAFNPTAASFVSNSFAQSQTIPTPANQSRFTPYQPLRISNGQHERHVLQQARLQVSGPGSQPAVTQAYGRYALRGKREMSTSPNIQPDKPILSVELTTAAWSQFGGRPINEALQQVSRNSQSRASRTPTPCLIPKPTQEYMTQASLEPYRLEHGSRKLLVVLDLNGTLLYRKNRSEPKNINMRPGVTLLLHYLFQNHIVMVYTSARPENAIPMVSKLMHPTQRQKLVAVWARDKLDLTKAQYNSKVQVYKRLEKIWQDPSIQKSAEDGRPWDQTNTVLVDDSHLKASSQPYNLLQVPEFINDRPQGDQKVQYAWLYTQSAIVKDLQQKIEQLKWQGDVSRQIRQWQLGGASQPATSEEHKAMQAQKQENADVRAEQLLTPKSPVQIQSDSEPDSFSCGDVEARSVSPIDEAVWSSLLAGDGKDDRNSDISPMPASIGPLYK